MEQGDSNSFPAKECGNNLFLSWQFLSLLQNGVTYDKFKFVYASWRWQSQSMSGWLNILRNWNNYQKLKACLSWQSYPVKLYGCILSKRSMKQHKRSYYVTIMYFMKGFSEEDPNLLRKWVCQSRLRLSSCLQMNHVLSMLGKLNNLKLLGSLNMRKSCMLKLDSMI